MPHRIKYLIVSLAALLVLMGQRSELQAQRSPTIAAASDLKFALESVAQQFTQRTGDRVELVFGSSGTLTRQLLDGAPFELFLSADEAFVEKLAGAGLTRDRGMLYAIGRVVVFAPHGSPLQVDERLDGLRALVAKGAVRRFAIANPEHAPYGRAAEAVLRATGLWDQLRPDDGSRRQHLAGRAVCDDRQCGWRHSRVLACVVPAFERAGHLRLIPESTPSSAAPANGPSETCGPGGVALLRVPPGQRRQGHPP